MLYRNSKTIKIISLAKTLLLFRYIYLQRESIEGGSPPRAFYMNGRTFRADKRVEGLSLGGKMATKRKDV